MITLETLIFFWVDKMKNINFLDLKEFNQRHEKKILANFKSVMVSSNFILGSEVSNFEENFSKFCNAKFCVAVSNGLDALRLILVAYGIKKGDEVIVPSNTFIATWLAVSHVQAKIIPVEPDINTYNISPKLIEKHLTKKTKAVICVHLYGRPANIEEISSICKKNKILLIEDAAQAHGAKYFSKMVGSLSYAAAFSFYPGKNLGAIGDAGAIVTNEKNLYKKLLKLRNYGSEKKYIHDELGFNNRMDEIQAAYLNLRLKHIEKENDHRAKIANRYCAKLKNINDLVLPTIDNGFDSVWHLFVVRVKKRKSLQQFLTKNHIQTLIHYPIPPFRQKAYIGENYEKKYNLSLTKKLSSEILSLPISGYMTLSSVDYICQKIHEFYST